MKTVDTDIITNTIKLEPASLEQCAEWKQLLGNKIVFKNGIYWEQIRKGFYQPIHFLQKLDPEQVKHPSLLSWGVRGAVDDKDRMKANGSSSYYTLENFKTFDFSMFSQKRRENIRKCFNRVEIREIKDENILLEQGYDVVKSSMERTRYKRLISKESYLKKCNVYVNKGDNSHLVLGAFQDNKLLAYGEMYAVENTAYMMNMLIATEALKYGVSAGLFYTQYVLAQHSKNITELYAGGYTPDDSSLDTFKNSMCLTVKRVPFFSRVIKPASLLLHMFYISEYIQLLGGTLSI